MDLERAGESINIEKLKARLQKRFPDYNFDVPAPPDTKCKAPFYCEQTRLNIQIWKAIFTVVIGIS